MSQFTRVTDRRTDGRTDGRTDTFAVAKTALHICSAVKKNVPVVSAEGRMVEGRCLDGVVDSAAACDFVDTVVRRFTLSSVDNVVDISSSSAAETSETSKMWTFYRNEIALCSSFEAKFHHSDFPVTFVTGKSPTCYVWTCLPYLMDVAAMRSRNLRVSYGIWFVPSETMLSCRIAVMEFDL